MNYALLPVIVIIVWLLKQNKVGKILIDYELKSWRQIWATNKNTFYLILDSFTFVR